MPSTTGRRPPGLELIQVHSGHVAADGRPGGLGRHRRDHPGHRTWPTSSPRRRSAASEWYYPERLSIDAGAAASLQQTPVATYLGLRLFHTAQVDVPLYAFQTALGGTDNGVADSAHAYQAESKIPSVTVVSRTTTYSHLDPLLATPGQNAFLATVVPWLRQVDR